VEKLLEDAQIKLSVVVSDILGVSGRQLLAAMIGGQHDPKVLAQLARDVMRRKITVLQETFTGYFTDHDAFLLAKMLARVDAIDADIATLDERIEQMAAPFAPAARRLAEIPGISATAAYAILAEIGNTRAGSHRRPPGLLGQVRPRRQGVRRQEERQEHPAGTATATWPGSSATPPPWPVAPIRFWESGTGASPAAAAARKLSSPPAGPSS